MTRIRIARLRRPRRAQPSTGSLALQVVIALALLGGIALLASSAA